MIFKKLVSNLFFGTVLICALACEDESETFSKIDKGGLDNSALSDISDAALVGTWETLVENENSRFFRVSVFNPDGSGQESTTDTGAGQTRQQSIQTNWQLDGNVLLVTSEETEATPLGECTSYIEEFDSVAIVGDNLYTKVLLRTEGNEIGNDGTWKLTYGGLEDVKCNGDTVEKESYGEVVTIEILGSAFQISVKWKEDDDFSAEYGSGTEQYTGTIVVDGEMLVLTPDDATTLDDPFVLLPVAKGVMLYENDMVSWAADHWAYRMATRQ